MRGLGILSVIVLLGAGVYFITTTLPQEEKILDAAVEPSLPLQKIAKKSKEKKNPTKINAVKKSAFSIDEIKETLQAMSMGQPNFVHPLFLETTSEWMANLGTPEAYGVMQVLKKISPQDWPTKISFFKSLDLPQLRRHLGQNHSQCQESGEC